MGSEEEKKKIYHYQDDGEYVGWSFARIDELESLVSKTLTYLLPAKATFTPPPEFGSGYTAFYNLKEGKWEITEDHRGEMVYSTETGEERVVVSTGPLPKDVTIEKPCENPVWVEDRWVNALSTLAGKMAAIEAKRYEMEVAGVTINGARVKTDRECQSILNSTWNKMKIVPNKVINWKGVDGWIEVDADLLEVLAMTIFDYVEGCWNTQKMHEENVKALAEDAGAVLKYDINTGWPSRVIKVEAGGTKVSTGE